MKREIAVRQKLQVKYTESLEDLQEVTVLDLMSWQQAKRIQHRLRRIEAALARLEAGTYGRCTHCGTKIAAERLKSLPEAERCLNCQRKKELGCLY